MAVPPPISAQGLSRDELRKHLRTSRQSVDKSGISYPQPIALIAHLSAARTVGSYVPIGSEAQPFGIENWCRKIDKSLYLPWFEDKTSDMIFRLFDKSCPLIPGPFNFPQPSGKAPLAVPELLIIPLLGFDRALNRIGQGQGHYDRYLAKHPHIVRIGLAHSCQEVDILPVEPWDIPLHAVLTEREWIERAENARK
jgi:5-formyltetrahydrofolate cyclo-ligase